jgi:hypothetical protein
MTHTQQFKKILNPIGKLTFIVALLLPAIPEQNIAHAIDRAKSLFSPGTDNSAYTTGALSEWLREFNCDENPQIGNSVTGISGAYYGPPRGGGNSTAQAFDELATGLKNISVYVGDPQDKSIRDRVKNNNFEGMVEFDGIICRPDGTSTLIEAKRVGANGSKTSMYDVTDTNDSFTTVKIARVLNQAKRQVQAVTRAGATGIEWRISDERVAAALEDLFKNNSELKGKITVVRGSLSTDQRAFADSLLSSEARGKTRGSALGGIDFSTLELNYIAEDSGLFADRGLKYAFNGVPAAGNKNLKAGRVAAAQASDAFFVWLSLSPDKFWVNLNPNEPDRIIDPQLGKTDAGRILLQSDFQMKKTVAKLIHPDTSLGKQFWQQLARSGSQICISNRLWIVPAPATVRGDGDGIYIVDAPLQVKMESQYLQLKGKSGFLASCPTPDKKNEAHNEAVYRKLVLPRIEQAVNKSPEYAELRRVYRSRVAAEWYRQHSASKSAVYRNMINKGDVSSWPARQDWSSQEIFKQYVNSATKGEFNVVHSSQWQEGNIIYTQKKIYMYGGVDFSRVFFKQLSSTDFQKKWGDLQQVVDTSMESPVADQNGKIWLGGSTTTSRANWKSIWFYMGIGFLSVPFLIRGRRMYRRRFQ